MHSVAVDMKEKMLEDASVLAMVAAVAAVVGLLGNKM